MQCLSFYIPGIVTIFWIQFSLIKQLVKRQLTLLFCCRCGLQRENCHSRSQPGSAAALGHGWPGTVRKGLLWFNPGSQPSCVAAPSLPHLLRRRRELEGWKWQNSLFETKTVWWHLTPCQSKPIRILRSSLNHLRIIKCGPNPASWERNKYGSIPNKASGFTV